MKALKPIASLCFACALLPLFARAKHADNPPAPQKPASAANSSPGERVFRENCARCHDAPQGFSQQISGTVIRHMRVRASLSAQDEQDLLKFLNP